MANLNRIVLIGNISDGPETRSTMDGIPMTKFKLNVARTQGLDSESFGAGGNDVFDIVAWRRLAEHSSKALVRGQMVLVEGRIQIRTFDDQTGQKRWATEIVARNIHILDKNKGKSQAPSQEMIDEVELASDLPF